MANELRGEVELKTPTKTFNLRMSINAIVNMEDHFDLGINEIATMLGTAKGMRLRNLRAVVFYALQDAHPDITELEAGEVITAAGFSATSAAIKQAMVAAFPEAKASDEAKESATRPRKAK